MNNINIIAQIPVFVKFFSSNKELLQIYDIIKEFLEYLDNEKEKVEVKK